MKYIRTNLNEIYCLNDFTKSDKMIDCYVAKYFHRCINKNDIVATADTIEELCDEFVCENKIIKGVIEEKAKDGKIKKEKTKNEWERGIGIIMKVKVIVQKEEEFDLRQFNLICEETIEENPNSSFDELVDKCYKNLLFTFIEDLGYKIISIDEQDKQKVLYWIKQNVKDILDERCLAKRWDRLGIVMKKTPMKSFKIIKEMYEYFVKESRDLEPKLMICEKEDFDNVENALKDYVVLEEANKRLNEIVVDYLSKGNVKKLKAFEIIKELFDFDFAIRYGDNQPMIKITNKRNGQYWELPETTEICDLLKEVLLWITN